MPRGSAGIGFALAGGTLLAFPVLLSASGGATDLVVISRNSNRFEVLSSPEAVPAELSVTPDDARVTRLLPKGQSGLDLTTWTRTYGGAYQREVTWPTLIGPFHREDEYVCGYTLRIGAGVFDTSGAGRGLEGLVHRTIAERLPETIGDDEAGISVPTPQISDVDFQVQLGMGRARLTLGITFVDGTIFEVAFPVRVTQKSGSPIVERITTEAPMHEFRGPLVDALIREARSKGAGKGAGFGLGGCALGFIGCAIGMFAGAVLGSSHGEDTALRELPRKAEELAASHVDRALSDLALGMERLTEPWHPFPSRPADAIRLRLDGEPSVTPKGLTLPICAKATIADGRTDPTVEGPVVGEPDRGERDAGGVDGSRIGLTLDASAVNHVTYYLWQAGVLREVGESPMILDSLSKEVRMAAFDFTGLDPGLPPTLLPATGGPSTLAFALGNVSLGTMDKRTVVGHGQALLGLAQVGDSILLQGRVAEVHVNCTEFGAAGTGLTPCLSDLLPVAREVAASREPPTLRFAGADLLGKLPTIGFQGAQVRLSKLRVASGGPSPRLDLTVNARIE